VVMAMSVQPRSALLILAHDASSAKADGAVKIVNNAAANIFLMVRAPCLAPLMGTIVFMMDA
jgi:hypothetical protein